MLCEDVAFLRDISGWVGQTEPLLRISELNFFPKGSTVISDRKVQEKPSLAKLHQPKKTMQHLPILVLQTLLYKFLASVYPGTKKFSQKLVLKFRKSSYLIFLNLSYENFQVNDRSLWCNFDQTGPLHAKKGAFVLQ